MPSLYIQLKVYKWGSIPRNCKNSKKALVHLMNKKIKKLPVHDENKDNILDTKNSAFDVSEKVMDHNFLWGLILALFSSRILGIAILYLNYKLIKLVEKGGTKERKTEKRYCMAIKILKSIAILVLFILILLFVSFILGCVIIYTDYERLLSNS